MKRHLSLKSEHLADLTTNELGAVAGGAGPDTKTVICLTGVYPTINYNCTRLVEDVTTGFGYSVDIC